MQRKWLCVTLETLLCDYKVIIYSSNELKKRKKYTSVEKMVVFTLETLLCDYKA